MPAFTGKQFYDCLLISITRWNQLLKKLSISFNAGPEIIVPLSLQINPSCQTLLKAFNGREWSNGYTSLVG